MSAIYPFAALRPTPKAAAAVASVPYDVVSSEEARALASGNPLSFLHVSRPEIDLDARADPHADAAYDQAATAFDVLKSEAPLVVEDTPSLYVYRLQHGEPRAIRHRRVFLDRRIRSRCDQEARENPTRQGRRPDAAHARNRRADRTGVSHVSRFDTRRRCSEPRRHDGAVVRLRRAGWRAPRGLAGARQREPGHRRRIRDDRRPLHCRRTSPRRVGGTHAPQPCVERRRRT